MIIKEDIEIWIRSLVKLGYQFSKLKTQPFGILIEKEVVGNIEKFIEDLESVSNNVIENNNLKLNIFFDKDNLYDLGYGFILKVFFK